MNLQHTLGLENHELVIELPNTPVAASHLRKSLVQFVEHFCVAREIIEDVQAVAGEALANAAEHGYRPRGTIRVAARISPLFLEASVSDDGCGFESGPISIDHPEALTPRGYGLFMMQTLVDAIEFRDEGRTVWFQKRLQSTANGIEP